MTPMLKDFNLLVSTSRRNERNACSETWYLLREVGDPHAKTDVTGIMGLVTAKTKLDPKSVMPLLRKLLIERPWEFRYVLKLVPIQMIVQSALDIFTEKAKLFNEEIPEDESFRVTVEKRRSNLKTEDIIEAIAPHIKRKVNLSNPDKIALVEVIGEITGLSLITADEILSVEREKRNL